MQLNCKYCNALIIVNNVDFNNTLVKCRNCNYVSNFAGQFPNPNQNSLPIGFIQNRQHPRFLTPKRVTVENRENKLILKQRWFSWNYVFTLFIGIIWYGAILFIFGVDLFFFLAVIFSFFPSLIITYWVFAGFFNSSIVEVTRQEISVRHSPLPWFGNKAIPTINVVQLFCEEIVKTTKAGVSRTYTLNAITRDGQKTSLLSGLESPDIGLFIEQQIESWLHIADRPVGGELHKY